VNVGTALARIHHEDQLPKGDCCMLIDAKFDIFKKLPDGHPMWVTAVVGLEEAKRQLDQITRTAPGEYFIYSLRNRKIIAI
jgi:hypothetical protein